MAAVHGSCLSCFVLYASNVYLDCSSCSDVPTKQFILSLDARLACVVSDLDATHVFVKKDSVKEIQ